MNEILKCRNCEEWYTTSQWRGNCKPHHTKKDRWSETASPVTSGCTDYTPKILVTAQKEVK